MAFIASLKDNKPGYADFEIKRWSGPTDCPLEFTIKHNQDEKFLAGHDEWKIEPVWHTLGYSEFNNILVGTFEPWVTDSLIHTGGQSQFLMSLRDSGESFKDHGVVRMSNSILASTAAGTLNRSELHNPTPVSPQMPEPEPYIEPEPDPEPEPEAVYEPEAVQAPEK